MREKIIKSAKLLIAENLKAWIACTDSEEIRNIYIDFLACL